MFSKETFPNQKRGHCLSFRLPGLDKTISAEFPNGRLPVCDRCKKNYKTKTLCRSRDHHKTLPWTQVYICMTLDPTCTDAKNNYVDGPFFAQRVEKQLFCFKADMDTTMPICATCKRKNYTRHYCRSKMQHRHLPWNTVYFVLSANHKMTFNDSRDNAKQSAPTENTKSESAAQKVNGGEDIHQIDESRTFFVSLSSKSCMINWLIYDEYCFETLPNKTEYVSPTPPAHANARQGDHLPDNHFFQQQNSIVQHIPQQYPSNYHQAEHWQHQPHPFNQEIYWDNQQAHSPHHGWCPSSHAGQGNYHHDAFAAERTHQMQQRVKNLHPLHQEAHGHYHRRFHSHVEASYSSRNNHVSTREDDFNDLKGVEDDRHSAGNSGQQKYF